MKIVVLTSRFPWPLDKGDKLRIYHQVKYLSQKHDVYLLALSERKISDGDRIELLKYCKEVNVFTLKKYLILFGIIRAFFSSLPLQVGYFYSRKISKQIKQAIENINPDFIYGQLVRVSEYIKESDYPKSLDLQDALSAGLKRRYDKSNFLSRQIFKLEYNRMIKYESEIQNYFDVVTIITDTDRKLLPANIRANVDIIPNGVDFDFFNNSNKDFSQREFDVVFTGNMAYPPNIKAAQFLVREIMPLVWKDIPKAKVLIAGASPSQSVKTLRNNLVEVSGWIDDIRTAYQSAKIFVAPMQIGTGLQNKLLEAMAMELPCVTSDLANNALKAKDGLEILISPKDSASTFAEKIVLLLEDENINRKISINGNTFVKQNYDWQNSVSKLDGLFNLAKK